MFFKILPVEEHKHPHKLVSVREIFELAYSCQLSHIYFIES